MTSFVNIKYAAQHHGADRLASAVDAAQQMRRGLTGTPGLSMLLLSAMAAAVMVVAYQVMDSVAEGHLLVMWIGLWGVAFATLVLFADTARQLAARLKSSLDGWSRRSAEARSDQRLWATAKADPRVMADLQAAMMRNEAENEGPSSRVGGIVTRASSALRAYQRNYI